MPDQIGMENRIDRVIILPKSGKEFTEQLSDCLRQVSQLTDSQESRIVQQSFFINAMDNTAYLERHGIITREVDKAESKPSTSIIAQPPAAGQELSMELILVSELSADAQLTYRNEQGISYTKLTYNSHTELYAGGISPTRPQDPFIDQVEKGYQLMEAILNREGMNFADIARQWNYVEEILSIHDRGEDHIQNYQVLNDVRTRYYGKSDFTRGYPAATGIGMNAGGIVLEIYAIKADKALDIIPIKNPKQVDAYNYSEKVLVGDAIEHARKKTTPKFERAKFVGFGGKGTIYISGTASIQNEVTLGLGDVEVQSKITIENITNLIAAETLKSVHVSQLPGERDYTFVRIYIKNQQDYQKVKQLCDSYYGDIPLHYLIADVCRDNLLLEIEGVVMLK